MQNDLQRRFLRVNETGSRMIRLGLNGMRLGAIGGAVYGGLFGTFGILVHHDPWLIVSMAIYFAKCGIAAGGILGICGGIFDRASLREPVCDDSYSSTERRSIEPTRNRESHNPDHPRNRADVPVREDRRSVHTVAS